MFDNIRGHSILVDPLLNAPLVVLDLGANHGDFSKRLRERFGGTYYLAEANPSLAQTLADENLFHVWHCAVATQNGTMDFNIAQHDESSSLLVAVGNETVDNKPSQKVSVPARTIDSLLSEIPSERIDLVKIDIEGMEGQALLGLAPKTLQKISQITVEFHCDERFGFDLRDEVKRTIRHLRANGFLAVNFSGTTFMDVLFINRRLNPVPNWKGRIWELAGTRPPGFKSLKRYVPENVRLGLNRTVDWFTGRKKESD